MSNTVLSQYEVERIWSGIIAVTLYGYTSKSAAMPATSENPYLLWPVCALGIADEFSQNAATWLGDVTLISLPL